jgi:hypothetical protein
MPVVNDYVPQQIWAFRVTKGTRSSITRKSGADDIITVKSKDYGVHTNQIKIWIRGGTVAGSKKILVNYKGNEVVEDNIIRKSISVQYIGEGAAATMSVNHDGCVIIATGDTAANMNISWEDCETLENLAARLNDTGLFMATLIDERPNIVTRLSN